MKKPKKLAKIVVPEEEKKSHEVEPENMDII
jgi:hypothetical protein